MSSVNTAMRRTSTLAVMSAPATDHARYVISYYVLVIVHLVNFNVEVRLKQATLKETDINNSKTWSIFQWWRWSMCLHLSTFQNDWKSLVFVELFLTQLISDANLAMMSLQSVTCDSEFRCEPMLQGESYVGVCVGQSAHHFCFISILFNIVLHIFFFCFLSWTCVLPCSIAVCWLN